MLNTNMAVRIGTTLKEQPHEAFGEMDPSVRAHVGVFAEQCLRKQGVAFECGTKSECARLIVDPPCRRNTP